MEPSPLKPELEKDLVTWIAPARPFKRRDKQFYLTTISIAAIVCLILFLACNLNSFLNFSLLCYEHRSSARFGI